MHRRGAAIAAILVLLAGLGGCSRTTAPGNGTPDPRRGLGGAKPASPFLLGADISMLARMDDLGAVFREHGRPRDPLRILADHGANACRLRLFVHPNHVDAVVNDLPYTLTLAERVHKAGMKLLLDIHYSDTWADPGHQTKPAAWKNLDFEELEGRVEDYTASVLTAFRQRGVLPDIVQLGNEITAGFLWPEGKLGGDSPERQWDRFATLLRAAVRGVRRAQTKGRPVRILIHIDRGGDPAGTRWFFDHLAARNVPFDLIGLSYYPWWHGPLDSLRATLRMTAERYGKPILVVETAYPYRGERWRKDHLAWPISPEGQRAFLAEVIRIVRATPNGLGRGVFYWYPESVPVPGIFVWNGGETALFDKDGEALPAVEAFGETR